MLELVEGATLAEKLIAGPLPAEETLAIAQQIAEALDAAHQRGVVHRDLKPGNIKVRDDGTVKVLDFGLATVAPSENADERRVDVARRDSSASPIITPAITTTGIILGTAAYMSPEQAKGNAVTRTTDIWAFGCVLYEMLSGRVPFSGDSVTDTLALIVRDEPDFGLLPSTTPQPIRTLLRHCLHKDQRRRWPDAGSLRIAIEDARDAPTDVATPAELTRPSNWRRMIVSAFVVVAAALSALGAWRLARQEPPRAVARVLIGVSPASQIARTLEVPNARPFRSAIALSRKGRRPSNMGGQPPYAYGIIVCMKKTLHIDEQLLREAKSAAGAKTDTDTVRLGLEALIRRAAYERLRALRGAEPRARDIRRRRERSSSPRHSAA